MFSKHKKESLESKSLVTAKQYIKFKSKSHTLTNLSSSKESVENEYPKNVIIFYHELFLTRILNDYKDRFVKVRSCGRWSTLYQLCDTNGVRLDVGVVCTSGIGAPVLAILMEELIACGVENFYTLGIAGAIDKSLKVGTAVLCTDSFREEGTSYHYLSSKTKARASKKLLVSVKNILNKNKFSFKEGAGWTTDAPYRETLNDLIHYRDKGVLTVDMEASALYSVAKYYNVNALAIFVISDLLSESGWTPRFDAKIINKQVKIIFELIILLTV